MNACIGPSELGGNLAGCIQCQGLVGSAHTREELSRIRLAQVGDDGIEILEHLPLNSISAYIGTSHVIREHVEAKA